MLKIFLQIIGWLLAHTPEPLLRGLAVVLGECVLPLLPRRRRLVYSNLHHAFPDRPRAWHRMIARQCGRRLVETALLSLATPYLSERRIRQILTVADDVIATFSDPAQRPAPVVFGTMHMAYWEMQTALLLFLPKPFPEFGIIYRPLDDPNLDAWLKSTRERFGMVLLSRKAGFQEALKILRRAGYVGVLFDQNAGMQGALSTLFGRVCSTTELCSLLAEKFDAPVYGIYPRRLGFWRIRMEAAKIPRGETSAPVSLALNRWLENLLRADDDLCASWLWSHDRWRNQDVPARRFRLEAKRDLIADDLAMRGWSTLPRKTRVWIRLPNWLGDVVMAIPLIRALRRSRPDAEITLIAKSQFHPLLARAEMADRLEPLPARGSGYFKKFWRRRAEFPDVYVLFTNSIRGDLEAWLTRCPQRFGIARPGRARGLLTHRYAPPASFDERQHHQFELWENFFNHFGLAVPPDRTPLAKPATDAAPLRVGFIAGSENNPEKRWPIAHWRALALALFARTFDVTIVLFGTANDAIITREIAQDLGGRITDLAGKTDLAGFMAELARCHLLVTNDTGGMHLANALGVPLIALFGPTNPVRTGPVFSATHRILQPPGSPPTGGAALAELAPETVMKAVDEFLSAPLARE